MPYEPYVGTPRLEASSLKTEMSSAAAENSKRIDAYSDNAVNERLSLAAVRQVRR